jgi:hypothetical protein
VTKISEFFLEIDAMWTMSSATRQPLMVLGAGALMMQVDYERPTKDGDILETQALPRATQQALLALAGRMSALHTRRGLYLEIVPNGLPFLPQQPRWNPLPELNAKLTHFELSVLDVVDVVVSKLARFDANDVSDIDAMIGRGLVPHDQLLQRFNAALDFVQDAQTEKFGSYATNLNTVERDMLNVDESEIELPSWIH